MLKILIVCLIGILGPAPAAASDGVPAGDFQARIRANDAPIAGRLTVHAYFLDSLDAAVTLPGPGRLLAVCFDEANGKNSFVVSGDLALQDERNGVWKDGFTPVEGKRISGYLAKDASRWALWWVPSGDSLRWSSMRDLKLVYGLSDSRFVPLAGDERAAVLAGLPWDRVRGFDPSGLREVGDLLAAVDPTAFDHPPRVSHEEAPAYPKAAKMWDFQGTVNVVAEVGEDGSVADAFVLHSDATHDLNVAALVAVMRWTFDPGIKDGKVASGGVVVPIRFSLDTVR